MPPIRTRPVPVGVSVGAPISLFYVTAERRKKWRVVRGDVEGEIDLRDGPDHEFSMAE
ncbi:MAG: hypothetical protein N2037_13030 [Acidimicrobiales bacterium]|nr:hypothetical protein [Acidimicrobiales bacterium]